METGILTREEVKKIYHIADNVKTIWDLYELLVKLELNEGITVWEDGLVKLTDFGNEGLLRYPNDVWLYYEYKAEFSEWHRRVVAYFEKGPAHNNFARISNIFIKCQLIANGLLDESARKMYNEIAENNLFSFNMSYFANEINISVVGRDYNEWIDDIKRKKLVVRHAFGVLIEKWELPNPEFELLRPYVKNLVIIPAYGEEYAHSLGYYPLPVGTILKIQNDLRNWEVLEGTTARNIKLKEVNKKKTNLETKEISDLEISEIMSIACERDIPLARGSLTGVDAEYIRLLRESRDEEYDWFFKLKKAKEMNR